MKKFLPILLLVLSSCYKPSIEPPIKWDCSDVLVYKRHWVDMNYKFQYTMQWKRTDGTYYNMDAWSELYWSKVVGDRRCN